MGPTRISPGRAASCSRAARFTALTGRERRLCALDDDLAGLDADARFELELVHGLAHRERGSNGPLGVVLVRLGNAEGRHHGVAGELLDDPPMLGDAVRHHVEELGDAAPDDLRVEAGGEARRVDDVDEQHGGELSLHL